MGTRYWLWKMTHGTNKSLKWLNIHFNADKIETFPLTAQSCTCPPHEYMITFRSKWASAGMTETSGSSVIGHEASISVSCSHPLQGGGGVLFLRLYFQTKAICCEPRGKKKGEVVSLGRGHTTLQSTLTQGATWEHVPASPKYRCAQL